MTTLLANSPSCTYEHWQVGSQPFFRGCFQNLPSINEDDNLDGSQFLEDMDAILAGVIGTTTTSSHHGTTTAATVLEECHSFKKPTLPPRDLTALMSESDVVHLVGQQHQQQQPQQTPRNALRARLDVFLSERTLENCHKQAVASSKKCMKDPDDGIVKYDSFMVWSIRLVDDLQKADRLLFKFTTDYGACFILKKKHAIDFIDILKKYSKKYGCTVFYQVYAKNEQLSRIVKNDAISNLVDEIISQADDSKSNTVQEENQPPPQEQPPQEQAQDRSTTPDNGTNDGGGDQATNPHNSNNRTLVLRFKRYMNRRRLKNLIRQQIGIAIGKAKQSSRGRSLLFLPLRMIWKYCTRNNSKGEEKSD